MASSIKIPLLTGSIFLALALVDAWDIHASVGVLKPLIIVGAAFVAGARLGPLFPRASA